VYAESSTPLADAPRDIELSPVEPVTATSAPLLPPRLAAFAGVKATVKVVAGEACASIGELLALKDGAVLTLDRAVDAPFDLVLDGAVLARGQLVAVGDRFGVRITEVLGQPRA
jgi:flagellar motor switch protein FliN/FliY